jgi:hypothetical protein
MRQAARLNRTPLILATLTVVMGLLVCSIGAVASASTSPAEVGVVIFQTFFSLAFAVVTWVGPGVAASTIANERSSQTLESLVLTGLSPRAIARGKFFSSLTYVGMYLVALAPVGALPFLFGGVTATEVCTAFVLLFVFAILSVGFGLAVSSATKSAAVALLVTLPIAVFVSGNVYGAFGVGLSVLAHQIWPGVSEGSPVWLPTAYVRAPFGVPYVVFLLLLPLGVAAVLASFFYEVTVRNLCDPSDDRSTGIKRWFAFANLALVILCSAGIALVKREQWFFVVAALGACTVLSLFALFVLAGDPPGATRRVRARWEREKASLLRRFLGPGIARTAVLLVGTLAMAEALLAVVGVAVEWHTTSAFAHVHEVLCFAAYSVAFFGFLAGFAVHVRGKRPGRFSPRALLALVLFGAFALPLFAVAIVGVAGSGFEHAYSLGAPSPLFVFAMMADKSTSMSYPAWGVQAMGPGVLAIVGWVAAGLGFGVAGALRNQRSAEEQERAWKAMDDRLAAEDAAAASLEEAATS